MIIAVVVVFLCAAYLFQRFYLEVGFHMLYENILI